MLKIKNNALYVFLMPVICAIGCENNPQGGYAVTSVTATHIEIKPSVAPESAMTEFLAPKVDSLSAVMNKKISYSPRFVGKNDQALGAWLSDISMEQVKKYLESKGEYSNIHVALFNSGGMRTSIPDGNINLGFVYEFMPFENSYVLVTLNNEAMRAMFDYLAQNAANGIFHPLGGMHLVYTKDGQWDKSTTVGQWRLNPERSYTVLTTDFLLKGGDNMNFFAKGTNVRYVGLKMREAIMDYLTTNDTITIPNDKRYEIN